MSRSAPYRLFVLATIYILPSCSHVQKCEIAYRAGIPVVADADRKKLARELTKSAAHAKHVRSGTDFGRLAAVDSVGDENAQPTAAQDKIVPAAATTEASQPRVVPADALSSANELVLVPPPEPNAAGDDGLSLAELERLAIDNNPTLQQAAWSVDKAGGIRRQVGAYPNPQVGYSASEVGNNGRAGQQGGYISQTIVLGNKLQLNQDVIDQDIQSLSWVNEAQRLRVLNDLRLAYFDALGAQRRVELTAELEKVAEHGVKVAQDLFAAKQGAKPDILQAEIQLNEVLIIRQNAENDYDTAWRRLASIVARPDMAPTPLSGDIKASIPKYELDDLYLRLVSSSPELQVAYAKVQRAQADIRRQQAQPIPNILTQIGVAHDYTSGDDIANIQIGVALPVFNRNAGNIRAAHAEYHRAWQDVERLRLALRVRLNDAFRSFVQARNRAERIEKEILPRADENRKLTEEAYRLGEFDFLRVLTARRTYFESNLRYVVALTELRKADTLIDGLLLTGGLDAPASFDSDAGLRDQTLSGK